MSTYNWSNLSGGAFDDAGNWSPGTIPGPSDTADFLIAGPFTVFDNGTAQVYQISDDVTFTGTIDATGPAYPDFTAFYVSGGSATFDGGTLDASSEVMVGANLGPGLLAFIDGAGGTLTATDSATALDIGYDYDTHTASGTVAVDGSTTTLTILGGAYVGVNSAGTFSITDGAAVQILASNAKYDTFEAGFGPSAPGTINVDTGATLSTYEASYFGEGGTVSVSFDNAAVGQFYNFAVIGDASGATVSFSNGASGSFAGVSASASAIYLGGNGGQGTLTADGAGTTITTGEGVIVGQYGNGVVDLTNGAALIANPLMTADGYGSTYVGSSAHATGTVTVDSFSTLAVGGGLYVGEGAAGVLNIINGGTGLFTDYVTVGDHFGSVGTLNIASGATATFDGVSPFDGGGLAESVYLGSDAGAEGIMTVDGTATTVTANAGIYVGFHGDGTLQLTDGAVIAMNPATIGGAFSFSDVATFLGSTGTLSVSGGAQITGTSGMFIGAGGYGSLDLTSGGQIVSDAPVGNADAGLGQLLGAVGVGTIDGATWVSDQSFFVGDDGSGTLTVQNSGAVDVDGGFLRVARDFGSSGTLTVDDSVVNAGNAVLTVGPDNPGTNGLSGGAGTLELQDGSAAIVGGAVIGGLASGVGSLDVTGSGTSLSVDGSLVTGAGTSQITVENTGNVFVTGAAEIGGGGGGAAVTLTNAAGFYDYGSGVTVGDLGTIAIDASSYLLLDSTVTLDSGTLSALGIDTHSLGVEISGGTKSDPSAITGAPAADMSLNQGVTFATGASAALLLGPAFDTSNVISNFASGDLLDVQISPTLFNTASYDVATSQLVLSGTAGAPVVLNLTNEGFTPSSFSAFDDGFGGTDVVLGPPCYVTGTNILTDHGEVAVEDLRVGDRLITRAGRVRALRWIGRRAYAAAFIAATPHLWPIRIAAGALAEQVPTRDLFVSPCHAMYFDHLLVPAAALLNGATITRAQPAADLTYYHLELTTHDAIFAEGAPAETYLDLGNRQMFQNAAEHSALLQNAQAPDLREYAPRHEHGPAVSAIRSRLVARASALGHQPGRALELPLDAPGLVRAYIPADTSALHLPSQTAYVTGDHRPLGALLRGLRLDGAPLPLSHPALLRGFHAVERHGNQVVRWTNGDAVISLAPSAFARCIEVDVVALSDQRRAA